MTKYIYSIKDALLKISTRILDKNNRNALVASVEKIDN
jgi:hypothetical protein